MKAQIFQAMGLGGSKNEDPRVAIAAGRRQTALVFLVFVIWFIAAVVLGLTFWQVSNEGTTQGPGAVCDFRPGMYTVGSVMTTCMWKVPNSAVRGLAGFLTLGAFWLILAKIGWWRTTRKIVYIILVTMSWVGCAGWAVIGVWDANEIRVAMNACKAVTNAKCDFGPYIALASVDLILWVVGWVFSIIFSVWISKEDFRRPVGMCGSGMPRGKKGRAPLQPEPSAPVGAEMDDMEGF